MSKLTPDLKYEAQYDGTVCGVDEAGRGPLAGPVVASAVILDIHNIPEGLNDSKALSETRREYLLNAILETSKIGIGIAEPEEIDRLNVLGASLIAMKRAILALPIQADVALIDGNRSPETSCQTETIVKGDAKSLSIAAASIVAKVSRDQLMALADMRYPGYGFAKHKGYPTKLHRECLNDLGPCSIHRRSFGPVKAFFEP